MIQRGEEYLQQILSLFPSILDSHHTRVGAISAFEGNSCFGVTHKSSGSFLEGTIELRDVGEIGSRLSRENAAERVMRGAASVGYSETLLQEDVRSYVDPNNPEMRTVRDLSDILPTPPNA
jgi:DNA topoisomerase IB